VDAKHLYPVPRNEQIELQNNPRRHCLGDETVF